MMSNIRYSTLSFVAMASKEIEIFLSSFLDLNYNLHHIFCISPGKCTTVSDSWSSSDCIGNQSLVAFRMSCFSLVGNGSIGSEAWICRQEQSIGHVSCLVERPLFDAVKQDRDFAFLSDCAELMHTLDLIVF